MKEELLGHRKLGYCRLSFAKNDKAPQSGIDNHWHKEELPEKFLISCDLWVLKFNLLQEVLGHDSLLSTILFILIIRVFIQDALNLCQVFVVWIDDSLQFLTFHLSLRQICIILLCYSTLCICLVIVKFPIRGFTAFHTSFLCILKVKLVQLLLFKVFTATSECLMSLHQCHIN